MVTATTNGIKVSVEVFYYPEGSNPQQNHYLFAYKISIQNQSQYTVQLLRRHWHIWESTGTRREVEGLGVVGEQPVIAPGQTHSYMSACNLHTEFGQMYGTFTMIRHQNHDQFKAVIPSFTMTVPYKLN